jgi:flagella basal body P-ring formation protein FlgA
MFPLRFLVFLLFAPSLAALAETKAPLQDKQVMRQLGNAWLEQQAMLAWPGVRARAQTGTVDERLALPACRSLQFSLPVGARLGSTGTLHAQCLAPARWNLYLGFQMAFSGPALVARRDLPARATVGAGDVEIREIDYTQPPAAYLNNPQTALGARTDRRIPAGQPLLAEWLSRPPIIVAGQRVRVIARGNGFSINQEGSALNAAGLGEVARVKIGSGRILHGKAQEDGSVLLQP